MDYFHHTPPIFARIFFGGPGCGCSPCSMMSSRGSMVFAMVHLLGRQRVRQQAACSTRLGFATACCDELHLPTGWFLHLLLRLLFGLLFLRVFSMFLELCFRLFSAASFWGYGCPQARKKGGPLPFDPCLSASWHDVKRGQVP